MNDVLNLPKNWVQVTVADLGKVVSGGTPSTKEPSYWGKDINWISPSDLTGHASKYIAKGAKSITQEGLKSSSATTMPAGSIHFSSRAPIGYTAISSREMTTNQGFKSLVPAQGVFNEYIYYYFKSAKQLAESKATGTTFKEISGAAFSKLPVPLPPTKEQHRIVAKIEELFSELDQGIASLKTAREQLKVYRQALLKHAFEGKLTAQWREEKRNKHRIDPSTEWKSAKIIDLLLCKPSNGRSVTDKKDGFKVLRLTALNKGRVDLGKCKEGNWTEVEAAPYIVKKGDFLLARGNGSLDLVGRGGLVRESQKVAYPDTMVKLSINEDVFRRELFELFWNCSFFRQQIEKSARTTAGIYKINQNHISNYVFPLPSLSDQDEILRLISDQLLLVEKLEDEIKINILKSESLRQSILKKAFSGRLVPQDENDEPASVLLERIKAEKAAQIAAAPAAKPKMRNAKPAKAGAKLFLLATDTAKQVAVSATPKKRKQA